MVVIGSIRVIQNQSLPLCTIVIVFLLSVLYWDWLYRSFLITSEPDIEKYDMD